MLYWRWQILFLIILAVPLTTGLCSKEQTEDYLTEGTEFALHAKQVDYVIVMDRSGSMEGVKMQTVKAAASELIDKMKETDRAAVISFNYEAELETPLTNNHKQLKQSVAGIESSYSTKYAPPLLLALEQFSSSRNEKALIFLSDGKSDYSEPPEEILNLTENLAKDGVCILTISYALGGEESPLLSSMAEVGKRSGCGDHFVASELGTELEDVFSHIYETVSSTEVIALRPFVDTSGYEFKFASAINNKPIPGSSASTCVEEPSFYMSLYKNGRLVRTYTKTIGAFALPPGEYTYKATAIVRCGGECSYIGSDTGTVMVGGVCTPGYLELATYITGETQKVLITKNGFSPNSVAGRQGTLVIWENTDDVPHRVMSEFFNETLKPGETFTYVIQSVGTLVYTDPDRNITATVAPVQGTGNDIMLIIDESGSMKGKGISEARVAAQKFFSLMSPADRGALLTFSENAYLIQDFTSDKGALYEGASAIRAEGATNYLPALRLAENARPVQQGILIFMSDGLPTDAEGEAAIMEVSERLRKKGWCIMTVGFGEEGVAARSVLAQMAADGQCGAFMYASGGRLTHAFGTIYQLSKSQKDISFSSIEVPRVTFQSQVTLKTKIVSKTGKPIPGSTADLCAPEATVQARTSSDTADLWFTDDSYRGRLDLEPGFNTIHLLASVAVEDEPGRAFVGTASTTTFYAPIYFIAFTVLAGVTLIYAVFLRRKA